MALSTEMKGVVLAPKLMTHMYSRKLQVDLYPIPYTADNVQVLTNSDKFLHLNTEYSQISIKIRNGSNWVFRAMGETDI
jgi:hypothetical protein